MPFYFMFPLATYLLASIPFGSIIGRRIANVDITDRGSGNIGATNVARELGLKWGIITLILDLLKGFVPLYIANYLLFSDNTIILLISISSLLGHQFSIFLKMKGGKGVATAAGIFLALSPAALLVAVILFVLTVYLSDIISAGSIVAVCSMPLILLMFGKPSPLIIISIITAILICIAHGNNIKRILDGKERKWRSSTS